MLTEPSQQSRSPSQRVDLVVRPSLSRKPNSNHARHRITCGPHWSRIYEVIPLICPMCGGPMRIIAFITFSADIHKILDHIGVDPEAPRIAPARGPPLWDDCGAQEPGEGVEVYRTGI